LRIFLYIYIQINYKMEILISSINYNF